MTYSESPFSQLSDELWHVFGGRRRFPTTRAQAATKLIRETGLGEGWGAGRGPAGDRKGAGGWSEDYRIRSQIIVSFRIVYRSEIILPPDL